MSDGIPVDNPVDAEISGFPCLQGLAENAGSGHRLMSSTPRSARSIGSGVHTARRLAAAAGDGLMGSRCDGSAGDVTSLQPHRGPSSTHTGRRPTPIPGPHPVARSRPVRVRPRRRITAWCSRTGSTASARLLGAAVGRHGADHAAVGQPSRPRRTHPRPAPPRRLGRRGPSGSDEHRPVLARPQPPSTATRPDPDHRRADRPTDRLDDRAGQHLGGTATPTPTPRRRPPDPDTQPHRRRRAGSTGDAAGELEQRRTALVDRHRPRRAGRRRYRSCPAQPDGDRRTVAFGDHHPARRRGRGAGADERGRRGDDRLRLRRRCRCRPRWTTSRSPTGCDTRSRSRCRPPSSSRRGSAARSGPVAVATGRQTLRLHQIEEIDDVVTDARRGVSTPKDAVGRDRPRSGRCHRRTRRRCS